MWWSLRSRVVPVMFWHYLFDGTILCPCERSRKWRAAIDANYRITGPGELWLTAGCGSLLQGEVVSDGICGS